MCHGGRSMWHAVCNKFKYASYFVTLPVKRVTQTYDENLIILILEGKKGKNNSNMLIAALVYPVSFNKYSRALVILSASSCRPMRDSRHSVWRCSTVKDKDPFGSDKYGADALLKAFPSLSFGTMMADGPAKISADAEGSAPIRFNAAALSNVA